MLEEYEREIIVWSVNFTRPHIHDWENDEEEHIGWSPCRMVSSYLLISRVANLSYIVSCKCQHLYSCIWTHCISIVAWLFTFKGWYIVGIIYRDIVFLDSKNLNFLWTTWLCPDPCKFDNNVLHFLHQFRLSHKSWSPFSHWWL